MVSSGLVDRVDVSHFRLSVHLIIAFLILSLILWNYLSLRITNNTMDKLNYFLPLFFLLTIFCQIIIGAFVSGLDAGNYELQNTSALTSATVAAPADVAGSVYYIDWSTPNHVNNGTSCAGCIDWRKLYEMLEIDETLKSIINWVNLSREDKKKSASREDEKRPNQKLL